jgi:GxxExxY protein
VPFPPHEPIPPELDAIAAQVVDAAFHVHKELGPGLLESVYEACLCYELSQRGLKFQRQLTLPVHYRGVRIDAGLRLDLLVEEQLIVENKAVEQTISLFEAQCLTYLRLASKRLCLMINYNVIRIKDGIKRVAL